MSFNFHFTRKKSSLQGNDTANVEKYGLFNLNEGLAPVTVDIIAVHGLGGHYETTWQEYDSSGRSVFWLKDFIPKQYPSARVMTYGYDSRTAFSQSVATIRDHAIAFLNAILDERRDETSRNRPVILIAHSLGGIIVKKAIIVANENTNLYGTVLDSIKGILFFGVPHRGSSSGVAYWGLFAARLLHAVNLANPHLVKDLQSKSKECTDISRQSVTRLAGLKRIESFYELEKTRGQLIVDSDSAILNLSNEQTSPMFGANHINICKFSHYESRRYKSVKASLERLVVMAVECDTTSTKSTSQAMGSFGRSPPPTILPPPVLVYPIFGQVIYRPDAHYDVLQFGWFYGLHGLAVDSVARGYEGSECLLEVCRTEFQPFTLPDETRVSIDDLNSPNFVEAIEKIKDPVLFGFAAIGFAGTMIYFTMLPFPHDGGRGLVGLAKVALSLTTNKVDIGDIEDAIGILRESCSLHPRMLASYITQRQRVGVAS